MKRSEDSLRDLWNTKCTDIHIIGVPGGKEREKGPEKLFEEVIAKNIHNMRKETIKSRNCRVPCRISPRRNTLRQTIKLTKIKDKLLKATKEKKQTTYKGIPISLSVHFFSRNVAGQKRLA